MASSPFLILSIFDDAPAADFAIEHKRPDGSTLSRWLKRATQQQMIASSGTGYRHAPFLYWFADREPLLWPGNHSSAAEQQAWRDRCAKHYGWGEREGAAG